MFLLDVNVLIALMDPFHVHHPRVSTWFLKQHKTGWATCPLTENGFIRIVGHANYPEGPGSSDAARRLLSSLISQPGHQFWPDSLSFCDAKSYSSLPPSAQLTDYYLLSLAVHLNANLATLDRRINPSLIAGGLSAYHIL